MEPILIFACCLIAVMIMYICTCNEENKFYDIYEDSSDGNSSDNSSITDVMSDCNSELSQV